MYNANVEINSMCTSVFSENFRRRTSVLQKLFSVKNTLFVAFCQFLTGFYCSCSRVFVLLWRKTKNQSIKKNIYQV